MLIIYVLISGKCGVGDPRRGNPPRKDNNSSVLPGCSNRIIAFKSHLANHQKALILQSVEDTNPANPRKNYKPCLIWRFMAHSAISLDCPLPGCNSRTKTDEAVGSWAIKGGEQDDYYWRECTWLWLPLPGWIEDAQDRMSLENPQNSWWWTVLNLMACVDCDSILVRLFLVLLFF